jgi:general secretion pathway protein D
MKPFALIPAVAALALVLALCGCADPVLQEAQGLARASQLPRAVQVLDAAVQKSPADRELLVAQARAREQLANQLAVQIDGLCQAGRWDEAAQLADQLRAFDARNARLATFDVAIARGHGQQLRLEEARTRLQNGQLDRADAIAREVLAEAPRHPAARALLAQIAQARPLESGAGEMAPGFQRPVTLEFRDAPLRQVFEALARSSSINFVFDRDVRGDAKVTVFLRQVTLDEALRVILSTQGLDRKLLNDSTVLVYPNTQAKEREHQELVTRTLYLTNADAKQVQAMLKTIVKVRDAHVDERLNMIVVRDTPEVMRLVEKLISAADLPEPEVMLDVQVLEISTDKVDSLGLQWPGMVSYGMPGASGSVLLSQRGEFRASIANPAVLATLTGTDGDANLLAKPKIRVRNKEKAKIQIGEKVPVFTTTTNFNGSTSVAASVSYLDVGLKLEVEPVVQLDNDVSIKVNLEVSSLLNQVTGPGGTTAYQTGQRLTTTTLRLADGETQVLAGLINDEDRSSSTGVPGLQNMPILGRLFGTRTDTRNKSEIVLLITPHVLRNLALPDAANSRLPSGTDASPGAFSTQLKSRGHMGVGMGSATLPSTGVAGIESGAASPASPARATVTLEVTPKVEAGGSVSVTLRNDSAFTIGGNVEYDAARLEPAEAGAKGNPGSLPVEIAARGSRVVVLRALPAAAGQVLNINIAGLQASGGPAGAEMPAVQLAGTGLVEVGAGR